MKKELALVVQKVDSAMNYITLYPQGYCDCFPPLDSDLSDREQQPGSGVYITLPLKKAILYNLHTNNFFSVTSLESFRHPAFRMCTKN